MRKIKCNPINLLALTVAGIINAVGVTLFLAPTQLFDSGISGTAFLLDLVTPPYLVLSMFLIVLNIPFFILGFKKLGHEFIFHSIYAIVIYSAAAFLFRNVLPIDFSGGSPFTGNDMLLSALFGGLLSGIGSGMVIRFGGAIDGIETMAVLFAKKLGLSVGNYIMIYNIALYTVSAFIFGSWLIPLYSIITYTVGVKAIDFVVEGLERAKAVLIVTDRESGIHNCLSDELGIGITVLEAKGVYSNEEKLLIYCVVNRFEIQKLKKIVADHDAAAFVTISEISESLGGVMNSFSLLQRR